MLSRLVSLTKGWVTTVRPPRPRRRQALSAIEHLEKRELLWANLYGSFLDVPYTPFIGNWQPGNLVGVTYRISNGGDFATGTGFSMSFYLSRDSWIGDFNDAYLGTSRFDFSLWAGYTTFDQYVSYFLPDASHPIWNGSGTYYIGMVVDVFNEVFENSDIDNAGIGLGWDYDQLYIAASSAQSVDLQSTSLTLNTSGPVQPNTTIGVTNILHNNGSSAIQYFDVAFYLSRDPYWDANDALLQQGTYQGIGAFQDFYLGTYVTLPANGHPVYQSGLSQYYILSVADPQFQLLEANESNNHGLGLGTDVAAITIQGTGGGGGDDDLPPTNFAPGKLTAVYFDTIIKLYQKLEKEYSAAAAKSGSVVNLNPMVTRIRQTLQALLTLRAELKAVNYTGTVQLGNAMVWNAEAVELLERVLVKAFVPGASGPVATKSARENPIKEYLKPAIKGVQSMLREGATTFFKVAAGFGTAAAVAAVIPGGQPVAAVLAKGAILAGTLGVMSYLGLQAVSVADRQLFGEAQVPDRRVNMDNISQQSTADAQEIPDNTGIGNALQNLTDANTGYNNQWNHQTSDDIEAQFDELFAALGKNHKPGNDPDPDPGEEDDLGGKYKGTYHYSIDVGGGVLAEDAPMSLTLRTGPGGQLEGNIKAPFMVYDPNTLDVKTRGRIKGEFTAQVVGGMLMGNVTYKTPNGTISSTLTWMIQPDGSLRGKPSDNTESDSFFELRPA